LAPPAIWKVAVICVEDTTVTPDTVIPLLSAHKPVQVTFTVEPVVKLVPVNVTTTLVPAAELVGFIDVRVGGAVLYSTAPIVTPADERD